MPKRFVIQEHRRADDVHWDLMLEVDNLLETWRLDMPPERIAEHPAEAVRIPEHPLRFLTYQGPVQNGAGRIRIADSGTYRRSGETSDKIELHLAGDILNGPFVLERCDDAAWQFMAIMDGPER